MLREVEIDRSNLMGFKRGLSSFLITCPVCGNVFETVTYDLAEDKLDRCFECNTTMHIVFKGNVPVEKQISGTE
jgi:ribosomal protein S27E